MRSQVRRLIRVMIVPQHNLMVRLLCLCLLTAGFFLPPGHLHAQSLGAGVVVAEAALARTATTIHYDPVYRAIDYPMGDVAQDRGVCADVVIRALRAVGVDLQRLIHEDMRANFHAYPKNWGATGPDRNIDHRRVLNIEAFFKRHNMTEAQGVEPGNFLPGDIVAWNLRGDSGGQLPHIGVVSTNKAPTGAPLIIHNIGMGTVEEDVLFSWAITGHYRVDPQMLIGGS